MKVVVYLPDYNPKHQTVLRAFAQGIPSAVVRDIREYEACDVAVIFGLVKKTRPFTWTKQNVLNKHQGRSLIVVEAGFVKRSDYWSIGFGGTNGGADFRNRDMPPDRWNKLRIEMLPWRSAGRPGPVIVCGQVPWDTNVQDTDHPAWCRETLASLHRAGVHALFRPHPRMKKIWQRCYPGIPEECVDTRPLHEVLADARCVVIFNSNIGVDAVVSGVPVVAFHPGSMAWPMATHDLMSLLNDRLATPSREGWSSSLAYAQWNLEDMAAGLPWQHLMRS